MKSLLDIDKIATTTGQQLALVIAQEQITTLRRLYAQATDDLGKVHDSQAQRGGLQTYHQIFTPNADIRVSGATAKILKGTGPDAWAEIARNALQGYAATQHLIGSQVVQFHNIEWLQGQQDQAILSSGRATMKSYLQAWHAWPDNRLRLVLGTYHDELTFTPNIGWQICAMNLEHLSGEERMLGT